MTMHLTRAAEGLERLAFTVSDLERMVETGERLVPRHAPGEFALTPDDLDEV